MERFTLDPKLDIVFKMMFAAESNRDILISFLNAVLAPSSPIVIVEIRNPNVTGQDHLARQVILDVHVVLADGSHIDVEMQARKSGGPPERWLFNWGLIFTDQLVAGDNYSLLRPVVCIIIMDFVQSETRRFHNVYRVQEVHEHTEFSEHLELHTLELPKLKGAPTDADDQAVLSWGRFFAATTDEELEQLAMNRPDIERAKQALDELSADPVARELARERKLAELDYQSGLSEARTEGEAKGLRVAVQSLCEVLGIELSPPRRTRLDQATVEDLQDLHAHIVQNRSWPDPS